MRYKEKAKVMTGKKIERALRRMAHEIVEKNSGTDKLALIGIKTRGVPLAKKVAQYIYQIEGHEVPVGILDVSLYRDDVNVGEQDNLVNKSEIEFSITNKRIVLIDDVLYTGRTVRAALDAIVDFGRPEVVQLAVLVDRGHREIPIKADYVGKNLPTSRKELVLVKTSEIDGVDEITIQEKIPIDRSF